MIKNLIIGFSLVSSVLALWLCLFNNGKNKTAYIDTVKVYSEFQLTKDLNASLEIVLKARKKILDSMYTVLTYKTEDIKNSTISEELMKKEIVKLEEALYLKQQQFEKENKDLTAEYNSKIWSQLNQYVSDYGKNNKYDVILGANGQGNIMYGNKDIDITNEIIIYSNNRFNDRTKK